jgi:hypothetical protein
VRLGYRLIPDLLIPVYHTDISVVKIWYTTDMSKTTRKTKALRLTPEDLDIIAKLRRYYGIASDNEVIRMALRSAERELEHVTPITPHKERPFYP